MLNNLKKILKRDFESIEPPNIQLKEETYNIDLKKDTTAWIVGLMTDDNLDILQVKNLKAAKDGEFTEVGIFNPRLNTYYFKTRPKRDYEL